MSNDAGDVLGRLKRLPDNRATLPGLLEALDLGVAPFVGGGLAVQLGLPSWADFLTGLYNNLARPRVAGDDEALAQLRRLAGDLYVADQLVTAYGDHNLPTTLTGPFALLPYLTHHWVLTTGLSRAIEAGFAQAGTRLRDVRWKDADFERPPSDFPCLLKLRGDAYDHSAQYLDRSAFATHLESPALREALEQIVQGWTLLFVGLDGADHKILDFLPVKGRPEESTSGEHYALLPASAHETGLVRTLYRHRVRPVWYPDEPNALAIVLDYLVRQMKDPPLGFPARALSAAHPDRPDASTDVAGPLEGSHGIPPIEIPAGLVDACARHECIAFVGSGLSARAGLPTWSELVEGILDEAVSAQVVSPDAAERQRLALRAGEVNAVADNMVSAFSTRHDDLVSYYRRASKTGQRLPRAFELLRDIPFGGVLTSTFDNLLERTYEGRDVELNLTPADSDKLLELISSRERPFVLKLHGDLGKPETLLLAPNDYPPLVRSNAAFSRFIEALFFSRTLLFLGVSLEGLTDYLSAFGFPSGIPRQHYALVAVSGVSWPATAELLKRRYNIGVIPFPVSQTFPEVDDFLKQLRDRVRSARAARPRRAAVDVLPPLRTIALTDIGPFKRLELSFEDCRTVLLGDNGVGKSSILRAIAVAIVGSDARHVAGRLIRAGQHSATVTITTARNPSGYVTEIQRVGSSAEVISRAGRPLETENWLALGFPALRTSSLMPAKGPQGVTRRPSADDLMPLLSGDVDVRLDDFKQWLVNTEAVISSQKATKVERARAAALKARFFTIVHTLTEDVLDVAAITPDDNVIVRTRDGDIPIESLSQGMSSLLSWVGIVLQRLYEVHYDGREATDPTQQYGLILMDEIDAHMHPVWQQHLMARLKAVFPGIQIIASTHSPLVVAGLPTNQVVRLIRAGEGIIAAPIDPDMTLGRSDQILTGDLFGLDTTLALGEETEKLLKEYERLLAVGRRNPEQEARYAHLYRVIGPRLPSASAETKLERRAQELVDTVLTADYSPDKLTELKASLAEATRGVLKSLGTRGVS